jgi:hypothetical protein
MARPFYRLKQAWFALSAPLRPVDMAAVEGVLSPELCALFRRMRRSEQQHSIRVMRTLCQRGHNDPALLTAALLHDVGKSRYAFGFGGRVAVVAVKRLAPRLYHTLSHAPPQGVARPFAISQQHPAWSAEDMHAAGASELACWLARHHAEPVGTPYTSRERLLAALQAADDVN